MPDEPISEASSNELGLSSVRRTRKPYNTNSTAATEAAARPGPAVAQDIASRFGTSPVPAVIACPADVAVPAGVAIRKGEIAPADVEAVVEYSAPSNNERNSPQLWTRSSGYKARQRSIAASNSRENRPAPKFTADTIGSGRFR